MRTTVLRLFTVLFLLATTLPAEVVIKRYDGPLPQRELARDTTSVRLSSAIPALFSPDKIETPSVFYFLPAFKIDSTSPSGETTAIAVRNEHDMNNTVTVQLFAPGSATDPVELVAALLPKEVWTINLRNETGSLPVDFAGFVRGYASVVGGDGPISADFFQIDSAQDFASGGRLIDFAAGEFCKQAQLRFLVGGAFTGGTLIKFLLGEAFGGDPNTDAPSITVTVYGEDGVVDGMVDIFTDNLSLEVDAANLINEENFGSMDIAFAGGTGGFAEASYNADNRYSVSIKNTCLVPPLLVRAP